MFKFLVSTIVIISALLGSSLGLPRKEASVNYGTYGVIPPVDDPLFPEAVELNFDEIDNLSGTFSVCSSTITGLSTMDDSISILPGGLLAIKIEFELTIPCVEISGLYTSDATLHLEDVLPELPLDLHLTGRGAIAANATNIRIKVGATLPYVGNANIRTLTADIVFDTAAAYLEAALLNGVEMDWEEFNANIKPSFDAFWAENSPQLLDAIKLQVNEIINGCTIAEFIDIVAGNGTTECLNIPPVGAKLASIFQNSGRIACRTIGYTCPASDGSFADPLDCASYFTCTDNVPQGHHTCPEPSLFNPLLSNCDFPWNVDCPVPEGSKK